jgi:hypothetical protein
MGNLEVQDQNCAVAYFSGKGLIDPARVGELQRSFSLFFSMVWSAAAWSVCLCDFTYWIGSN